MAARVGSHFFFVCMKQGIRKGLPEATSKTKTKKKKAFKRGLHSRPHKQKYGTSKLEHKFASEYLDKLGVKYEWQFEAKSSGRFYDFCIPGARLLIECDGDYYHGYDKKFQDMSPMQKHNAMVDSIKDKWAHLNGYRLIRIWEHDINNNSDAVFEALKRNIGYANVENALNASKKVRH